MNLIPFRSTPTGLARVPVVGPLLAPVGIQGIVNWLLTVGTAAATAHAHVKLRQQSKEG